MEVRTFFGSQEPTGKWLIEKGKSMASSAIIIMGAGQMGQGIAQIFIQSGYETYLIDPMDQQRDKAVQNITKNLDRLIEKNKLESSQKEVILKRLHLKSDLVTAPKNALFAIEAVPERLDLKEKVFAALEAHCDEQTIIGTNTSSFSITKLATFTKRSHNFIGIHFMNPVPVMPLVEIITGLNTNEATLKASIEIVKAIGKEAIIAKDSPGFIVNRILIPMINEAVFLLHEGVASAQHIDQAMKLGANHPLGPLALADLIGLDTCLFIMQTLHQDLGEDKYRPCPLLTQYVDAGKLGKKTGVGFYQYS